MKGRREDLFAGMMDGESGEEALGNGLLDDLKSCTDESLAGDDRRECGQNEHGPESATGQA